MLDVVVDVVLDAVLDTLYLVPFLLVTYLVMEWIEHRTGERAQRAIQRAGVAGPAIGAVLGVVPQCGFSAATSTLYAGRVVTLGTLFAVYLSTSDEMLPIFIAEQVPLATMARVLGAKVVIGMAFGFLVDAVLRARHLRGRMSGKQGLRIHELCERDHCDCTSGCATCAANPELAYQHHDDCAQDCTHERHAHDHSHDAGWGGIAKSAVKHTLEVTLFVLLVSLVLNALLAAVGEDALAAVLGGNPVAAVVVAGVVGLIPNCAASVAIAQLYVEGVLGAGAMLAGLLSAAGVGLLVLFRSNRPVRENVAIVGTLLAVAVLCGLVVSALGLVF